MFTTYAASAGSGKTTHLVADYIALCLKNDSKHVDRVLKTKQVQSNVFHGILAITFTNNAAAEMKDRIVKMLQTFAFKNRDQFDGRANAIYDMVKKQLFGDASSYSETQIADFIKLESLELLRSIIYDYARFSLTTIDSFFQRVIRSSALMLNLNLNYSVQIDLNEFYIQAIDQLINELYGDKDLQDRLMNMLEHAMNNSGKFDVDNELKSALTILYGNAEKNFDYLQDLQKLDLKELKDRIEEWHKNLEDEVEALKADIKAPLAKIAVLFSQAKDGVSSYANNCIKKMSEKPEEFLKSYEALETKTVENLKEGNSFKPKYIEKNADDAERLGEDIKTQFIIVYDKIVAHRKKYLDVQLMSKNADKLLLFSDLQTRMEAIKQKSNFFILSESNTLIYKNIKDQDIPVIFDPIKFQNFFIDEFQDTSQMQWRDLKPLLENNALSNGKDVTLFGDVKQAIYRFRNGDVNLFYNLIDKDRMQLNEETKLNSLADEDFQKTTLNDNYRSLQSVVKFNNGFFKYYSQKLELSDFYEDVEQGVKKDHKGLVQLYFIDENSAKQAKRARIFQDNKLPEPLGENPPYKNSALETYINTTETLSIEEVEVLRAVSDAIDRGYALSDIAILYSGNAKASKMARLLMDCNYNVITEKSLSLDASPAISLILNTMRYLLHPSDLLAQTMVIYYLSKLKGKDTNYTFQTMLFTLEKDKDFEKKVAELNDNKKIPVDQWLTQPLYVLLTHIIDFFGLDKKKDPFVVDLNNLIIRYLQSHNGELSEFLNWWKLQQDNDNIDSLTLPSGVNAITITTIHKSKGLEYPVVILPVSKGGNRPSSDWMRSKDNDVAYISLSKTSLQGSSYEELLEEEEKNKDIDNLNKLYVAQTRATDVLYVITSLTKDSEDDSKKDSEDDLKKDPKKDSKKISYANALRDYVNETLISSDEFKFQKDEKDACVFFAGDYDWKKVEGEEKKAPAVITPDMKLSDFFVEHVAELCEAKESESEQQVIGNYVHDFLAKQVDFPQTLDEVEACIAQEEEDKKVRLREAFHTILDNEKWKPYFAPDVKVMNEVTILDQKGKEHRPDRVVFLQDEVVVLDYKTGQPSESYQKQIDEYCNLLTQMGYEHVRGELLYV